ncbi:hypothetical protein G647_02157 [Cladophialophora carrionii CBS 160.54]|uniref:CENP-V/GFA domain-containing protein n=1 Tax=Cladophialophora carrionii CBS 160.54 TaxID=1279043 RepID=V9DET4_9EURO|nr:uncharacterized protein G647_02157 [Cladophialophora carrionii CBS 160.54]ETI25384.1 hypothetical protein G647_02157 [Cladophialophora carrionii CBS 160.54]
MATPSHLTCLCGSIKEEGTLLASQTLPIENDICHCNTCRHTTGSLGAWYVSLKASPSAESLGNATAYKTSEKYTRFFCKKCGCNVFVRSDRDGRWAACSGVVEMEQTEGMTGPPNAQKNVSRVLFHEYVGDAKDGGIAPFLTKLGDRDVPCYDTEPQEKAAEILKESELQQLRETSLQQPASAARDRGAAIEVSCHCGACQLRIAPPPYEVSSEGWYVPKSDRNKYYARLCGCRSCRLTLGFTLQPWAYVPPSQIHTVNDEPVVFGPKAEETLQIEMLRYYRSSEFVLRSFCTVCGATMYYQSFERPYIIDVSVGVLRSRLGNVMAGEWLEWDREIVSKRNECVDEELVDAWMSKSTA